MGSGARKWVRDFIIIKQINNINFRTYKESTII